jgi:hypothetical protein
LVRANRLEHVDVAFVGKHFLEIEVAAVDVAEMDHEDAAGRRELLDDRDHRLARPLEHFRDRAPAEVQTVILAGTQLQEAANAVGRAHHVLDAVQAADRIGGIVRMARQAYARLVRSANQALDQKFDRTPAIGFGHLRHIARHLLAAQHCGFRVALVLIGRIADTPVRMLAIGLGRIFGVDEAGVT